MSSAVTIQERNIVDSVLTKVNQFKESNELKFPPDYSPENALKSALLILQETKSGKESGYKPALEHCTKSSVANTLLDMVVQGLNPVKKQCYFVVYGNQLQLQRSYMGTVALARRYGDVVDVRANIIYEGDNFDFEIDVETGNKKIVKHKQSLLNFDNSKIMGAYAILTLKDGQRYIEIMNINQIQASWNQGATKGSSPAHKNFSEEMAKKTVINRACKLFINASSDAALFDDEEYEKQRTTHAGAAQIDSNANKGATIGFTEPVEATAREVEEAQQIVFDASDSVAQTDVAEEVAGF